MKDWLSPYHPDIVFRVPELPYDPQIAISTVTAMMKQEPSEASIGLIGSSLGGFYASYLCCSLGLRSVLINPAFNPHLLLEDYLGWNENYHTGERHLFTREHIRVLKSLVPTSEALKAARGRLFLVTQTGDEVLNYREAFDALTGSPAWIQPGGNHGFENFLRVLPAVVAFLFPSN